VEGLGRRVSSKARSREAVPSPALPNSPQIGGFGSIHGSLPAVCFSAVAIAVSPENQVGGAVVIGCFVPETSFPPIPPARREERLAWAS